jgi:secreted trypsin-like serine protease
MSASSTRRRSGQRTAAGLAAVIAMMIVPAFTGPAVGKPDPNGPDISQEADAERRTDESRATRRDFAKGAVRTKPDRLKEREEVEEAARPKKSRTAKKGDEVTRDPKVANDPNIVGGTVAPPGSYPFFVSIKRASDNFPFCGGTLVSSVWVLTAAHCVDGSTTAASLKLVIGAWQLDDESPGDIRSVTAIHLHPSWNPSTFDNDVALLRLNTASTKAWARLAEAAVDPVAPGNIVRAIGHGHTTQGGVASNDLRQVDLPIQSDATMSDPAVYGSSFHGAVMIGAGPLAGGQDTCQGDSGGPLFIAGFQARLVGDTSWGAGCAQPNKPGVYGEVYQGALRTFVNGLVARPVNDNFAGSGIAGADGTVSGNNTDATGQTGEPSIAGSTADTSVWYSWTAPENGPTTFNTRDAAFDTTLGVFTGNTFGTLASVASNDDTNGTLQSRVTFNAVAGTTYRIAVDGFGAAHGPFSLQYAQNSPAHDQFASPKTITGATGKDFSNNNRSTGEPGEPNHGSIPDRSVWYSWTAPETGTASFNTRQSNFDTVVAAYTGTTILGLTQLASNDQFNGTNQSKITFPVTAGTTYRIAVDGFGATTGDIGLQWTINAPANDNFASPMVVSGPTGDTPGTTVRSTGEPGELDFHGGAAADNSVWYSWTPPIGGPAVMRLHNVAGGLLPGFEIYTGTSLGALTTVGQGATQASFTAVASTTYRIAVDGNGGSTGTFLLEWLVGTPTCNGLDATIIGSGVINGTSGNDVIVGSAGNDTINGGGGNDIICALGGNDGISGGPGADVARGGPGNDTFTQTATADSGDVFDGGPDIDTVSYQVRTSPVNVTIDGVADDGGAGEADQVLVTVENVIGGSGNDVITGSVAPNTLTGGAGDDTLSGLARDDILRGQAGNDTITGGGHNDTVDGGDGNDRLFGDSGDDSVLGGAGDDVIGEGTAANGADVIHGGAGNDRILYSARTAAVTILLNFTVGSGAAGEGDKVGAIEEALGGSGNDTITGISANEKLFGNGGNDTITGNGGNDFIVGGAGADDLFGNGGNDALNSQDGVNGNDSINGGPDTDSAVADPGDTVIGVP